MNTQIQVECPQCHSKFSLASKHLENPQTRARCGNCQHVFVIQSQVVQTAASHSSVPNSAAPNPTALDATASSTAPEAAPSTKQANKKTAKPKKITTGSSDFLIHDNMISDDMDMDDDDETETSTHSQNKNQQNTNNQDGLDLDFDIDNWVHPNATTANDHLINPTGSAVAGASLANNAKRTHAFDALSEDDSDSVPSLQAASEDSWLERLLEEDAASSAQSSQGTSNTTDMEVANLLEEYGVDTITAAKPTQQDTQDKIDKRLANSQHHSPQQRSFVAMALWFVGCLILSLLLLAQYVIFNLDDLVKKPNIAQHLQNFCHLAACSLPSANANAFAINDVNVRASQVTRNNTDILGTLLNNDSNAQLYPNLKVSLYEGDTLIGEFIATPADYLIAHQRLLGINQSAQFMFTADIAKAKVSSVDISPFY